MEKYIPLALALFLIIAGVYIERSIFDASAHASAGMQWLSTGLEWFVFIIWALGIFVIGAMQKDFMQEENAFEARRALVGA